MAKKKTGPWRGRGKNRRRWVTIKKPPVGTYDLSLDQSLRASQRGLGDLIRDIRAYVPGSKKPAGTQSLRALEDVMLSREDIGRQRGYVGEDYTTGVGNVRRDYARTMEDLLSQQNTLERNYQQLAGQQRQNFQAAGLAEGGAGEQARLKRAANQAIEMQPITTARTRALQDRDTSLSDLLRQQQRSTKQLDSTLGEVNLSYGRGVQDRATQLARARREARAFKADVAQTRMQQYTQGGGRTRRKVGPKLYRRFKRAGVIY